MITIEPYTKLNGKTYYRVYLDGRWVGQFYTRTNAERFVNRELLPMLAVYR